MLDIRRLRENPEDVAQALLKKGYSFDSESFKALDAQRKEADVSSQSLQADKKKASKKVGQLIGQGMSVDEAKAEVAKELEAIDEKLGVEVEKARAIQSKLMTCSCLSLTSQMSPYHRVKTKTIMSKFECGVSQLS